MATLITSVARLIGLVLQELMGTYLKDIENVQIDVVGLVGVIDASALDDDSVGGQIDPPGEGGRADEHSNRPLAEEAFHKAPVGS